MYLYLSVKQFPLSGQLSQIAYMDYISSNIFILNLLFQSPTLRFSDVISGVGKIDTEIARGGFQRTAS